MEFPTDSETPFTFGLRNCGIGDANGDGYDDFLVNRIYGSDCSDTATANRIFLFLGGWIPSTEAILTFEHCLDSTNNDGFGVLVINGLGDVNGDGYDDFAIVAHHAVTDTMPWGDIAYGGKVNIYYGGQILDTFPDLVFRGNIQPSPPDWQGGTFASAVCGADVNGDGYKDIIIGSGDYAPTMQWYNRVRGRVYIYYGGPDIDTVPDIIINGGNYYAPFPARYEQLGCAIDNLGDVNSDGCEDIIVGALNNMERGIAAGKVYLFYGGNPMDTIPDWWFYGSHDLQNLGEVVSNAGDFNGDGYADIMIGDYGYENMPISGRVLIFFGGPSLDTIPDWTVSGQFGVSNGLGGSVDCIRDINEDGYDDIVVGNIGYRFAGELAGRVILYYGGRDPDTIPDLQYVGTPPYEKHVGWNLCSVGDVNGDGLNEIMFGTNYPPIVPFPDVYGWVRVMKYSNTAYVDTLQIVGGDCYVLMAWQGEYEENTTHYQILKNNVSDTTGWWLVTSVNPNSYGSYSIIDHDVQFTKSQYYWLKIYDKFGKSDILGPYTCAPVPLETKDFSASWMMGGVIQIEWKLHGGDIIGYNLYRELNGAKEKVNPTLMPADKCFYQDFNVTHANAYTYWLGILQSSQEEMVIGPVIPSGVVTLTPNPFCTKITIGVRVFQDGFHTFKIYNSLGQMVKTLWHGKAYMGYYEAIWDGTDSHNRKLPSGVYYGIYEMGYSTSKVKITLIR